MDVASEGLSLPVRLDGTGDDDPVVLLHGFPQTSRCWDAVSAGLVAAGRRTYAPDQRGYSDSARPTDVEAYGLDHLVADALAVLDATGSDQVDLVGHDWGAVVSWALAAMHPDRVRSLVAVSVPHPRAYGAALATDEDQKARSAYIRLFREEGKAEHVLLADGARRLRAMFAGSGLDDAGVDVHVGTMDDATRLAGPLAWYRAMGGREFAAVPAVAVPTTFVWGTGDLAVGATAAHGCAALVTGPYRFVPLDGVSHWVPDAAPQAVVDAVLTPPH